MNIITKMSDSLITETHDHLLPAYADIEEAGFGFANFELDGDLLLIHIIEWMPLKHSDFQHQYGNYLELSNNTRARIIKNAHKTNTLLVEFHSHPFPYPASFSHADICGLNEFVPHVMWRLPNRPYLAIVVAPSGYDALAWINKGDNPLAILSIRSDSQELFPTNLSLNNWS